MYDPLIPTPTGSVQSLTRWTLPSVKETTVDIDGAECDALICKANGYAYGLPDGFSTGAMMNLDLSDNRAIVDFVERYGLPVSPYANQTNHVEQRFKQNDAYSIDPVGDGLNLWRDGFYDSQRSQQIAENLGPSPFNHFKDKRCSAGTAIANLIKGIRPSNSQIILVNDIRTTLAFMQLSALLLCSKSAFGRSAYDAVLNYLGSCPSREVIVSVFKTLSYAMQLKVRPLDGLSPDIAMEANRVWIENQLEDLEKTLALFIDLAINPDEKPKKLINSPVLQKLLVHRPNETETIPASLTRAFALQLERELESGQEWFTCSVCGRPYKHKQQLMHAITNQETAEKECRKVRRGTRKPNAFCCKAHEELMRRKGRSDRTESAETDQIPSQSS